MAFSDIESSEQKNIIDIAIVSSENDTMYKMVFESLSSGEDKLFNIKYVDNDEAKKLLEEDKITGYFDIKNDCYWDEMLEFIGIDKEKLPKLCDSGVKVGEYNGVSVSTSGMDQIAGAIGAGVVDGTAISEMTGTTMVVFAPTENIPEYNPESIIPVHKNYDGKYCLLSWTPTAGIALKWFKNNFCENFDFKELDGIAKDIPAANIARLRKMSDEVTPWSLKFAAPQR